MKRLRFWRALGIIMIAGAALGIMTKTTVAQQITAAEKGTPTEMIKLEDIVITATKVEREIANLPVSASVVTWGIIATTVPILISQLEICLMKLMRNMVVGRDQKGV